MPARLLTLFPRAAFSVGVFEAFTAGPKDLDARVLSIARITASVVGGCPFCVDMNAAASSRNGLSKQDLAAVLDGTVESFTPREATAARYARALSLTPVELDVSLREALLTNFTPRERVVLAHTIAQVNYWTRFNQGLDVPSAGFCS